MDSKTSRGGGMDTHRTGQLIAARRKELGLTQKQLAAQLNVSDRAVSKWERGAGFPDIALLEPLADALGLTVLSLLHGEADEPQPPDDTVRELVGTVYGETRRGLIRKARMVLTWLFFAAVIGLLLFMLLDMAGAFDRPVELTVPVGVYVEGKLAEESSVHISGTRDVLKNDSFDGVFAIEYIEETCRDGATAGIRWIKDGHYQLITYIYKGTFLDTGLESMLYISQDMQDFDLRLEGGTVIATDAFYAKILELDGYYPLTRC